MSRMLGPWSRTKHSTLIPLPKYIQYVVLFGMVVRGGRMLPLIGVAFIWGVTNVLMRRFSKASCHWLLYFLCLAVNLSGSVLYYKSLQHSSNTMVNSMSVNIFVV